MRKKGVCQYCEKPTSRPKWSCCVACRWRIAKKDPDCRRYWAIKKKYGLDKETFDGYWMAFYGKCNICKKDMKFPEKKRGQQLDIVSIDHDHKSNKPRGFLCGSCNKGLGFFNDDIELLEKAILYLKKGTYL